VAHHVPAIGADRITLTAAIINRAACVVFLVAGPEKASAVVRVLHGPREPDPLPAQVVAPEHGRLLWLLEREAARLLQREAVE
jgi:6-phosphogluconolactonase